MGENGAGNRRSSSTRELSREAADVAATASIRFAAAAEARRLDCLPGGESFDLRRGKHLFGAQQSALVL